MLKVLHKIAYLSLSIRIWSHPSLLQIGVTKQDSNKFEKGVEFCFPKIPPFCQKIKGFTAFSVSLTKQQLHKLQFNYLIQILHLIIISSPLLQCPSPLLKASYLPKGLPLSLLSLQNLLVQRPLPKNPTCSPMSQPHSPCTKPSSRVRWVCATSFSSKMVHSESSTVQFWWRTRKKTRQYQLWWQFLVTTSKVRHTSLWTQPYSTNSLWSLCQPDHQGT